MTFDEETRRFYAQQAATYAARQDERPTDRLDAFLAGLPDGGTILELGCGGGQDSRHMLDRGFDVTPTDGSPELAAEAEKLLARPVRVMTFDALDDHNAYDGVWACACLLHVPIADLPIILRKIHRALRRGGRFVASFKVGQGEGRDRFGRYYSYPSPDALRAAYETAGEWDGLALDMVAGSGYDGMPTDWAWITVTKG